jgi:Domain of unknown function (DUF4160)
MPVISMFYGIVIRLYFLDNRHHHLPHIHAKYGEFEVAIGIADGEVLSGELPRKQLRLVQAGIELRRDDLAADWELAANGENPFKIDPL